MSLLGNLELLHNFFCVSFNNSTYRISIIPRIQKLRHPYATSSFSTATYFNTLLTEGESRNEVYAIFYPFNQYHNLPYSHISSDWSISISSIHMSSSSSSFRRIEFQSKHQFRPSVLVLLVLKLWLATIWKGRPASVHSISDSVFHAPANFPLHLLLIFLHIAPYSMSFSFCVAKHTHTYVKFPFHLILICFHFATYPILSGNIRKCFNHQLTLHMLLIFPLMAECSVRTRKLRNKINVYTHRMFKCSDFCTELIKMH